MTSTSTFTIPGIFTIVLGCFFPAIISKPIDALQFNIYCAKIPRNERDFSIIAHCLLFPGKAANILLLIPFNLFVAKLSFKIC